KLFPFGFAQDDKAHLASLHLAPILAQPRGNRDRPSATFRKSTIREHLQPSAESTALVRECARRILGETETEAVYRAKIGKGRQAFRDYIQIHGDRLAFDLDHIKSLVPSDARML